MDYVRLGMRLQALRESKNLTQAQAARRLGVSPSRISAYERGTRAPNIHLLADLALLYGTSLDDILGLEKPPMLSVEGIPPEMQKILKDFIRLFQ